MTWQILTGDCREVLASLPAASVHTCVTSPPYFGLRDYGRTGQIGAERNLAEYVTALVGVFREVRRVLRDDGTVWLNLGDSYDSGKSLMGVPWKVALRLKQDGWILRSEIIWAKPNPMPESVTDRPTKSHEQVFLLSKRPTYFYDADAIREAHDPASVEHQARYGSRPTVDPKHDGSIYRMETQAQVGLHPAGRNKRSVWTVATQPYAGAHFATFPPKLIEPCILAGCPERCCSVCGAPWERVVERERWNEREERRGQVAGEAHIGQQQRVHNTNGQSSGVTVKTLGFEPSCTHNAEPTPGTVLDPFAGAGTTGMVALRHGRSFVGIELNEDYAALARRRIVDDCPLWNTGIEVAA